VTSYEVGAKARALQGRLQWRAAAFHARYNDIQLVQSDPASASLGANVNVVRNGGQARVQGAELDFSALLSRLRLSGNLGLTHARFTRLAPGIREVTLDSNFQFTPKWTARVGADLPVSLSIGELELHGDFSWRDDIAFAYEPASPAIQPAYGVANASITLRLARGDLDLSFWGRNLADRRYFLRIFAADIVSGTPGEPRTLGASLVYRFQRPSP